MRTRPKIGDKVRIKRPVSFPVSSDHRVGQIIEYALDTESHLDWAVEFKQGVVWWFMESEFEVIRQETVPIFRTPEDALRWFDSD